MVKPILWGGFEVGTPKAAVLSGLPGARQENGEITADLELLDCEFKAVLTFDDLGLSQVDLHLVRPRADEAFADVLRRLISAISAKHGRGETRHVEGDITQKRWREPWVSIELIAVDDPDLQTALVSYKKIAITDAAYRYL